MITACTIELSATAKTIGIDDPKVVFVTIDDVTKPLFTFFSDEISFTPEEFIGLTAEEALRLFHDRDVAYLQSP